MHRLRIVRPLRMTTLLIYKDFFFFTLIRVILDIENITLFGPKLDVPVVVVVGSFRIHERDREREIINAYTVPVQLVI